MYGSNFVKKYAIFEGRIMSSECIKNLYAIILFLFLLN